MRETSLDRGREISCQQPGRQYDLLNTIGRETMGEVVHTSKIRIVREKGPTRKAMIEGFTEPVYYGVHGGIMKFYKIQPEEEHAATLDHIVAATAA
jgi:hypothetical protein